MRSWLGLIPFVFRLGANTFHVRDMLQHIYRENKSFHALMMWIVDLTRPSYRQFNGWCGWRSNGGRWTTTTTNRCYWIMVVGMWFFKMVNWRRSFPALIVLVCVFVCQVNHLTQDVFFIRLVVGQVWPDPSEMHFVLDDVLWFRFWLMLFDIHN